MADLATRSLGRTGLKVTMLGFGAMELRGVSHFHHGVDVGRPLREGQAEQILNHVLDSGINYIDTSVDYGNSEESIGKYISHRREEYFLASKCGCLVGASPILTEGKQFEHVFTKANIVAGVQQSLRRMNTDYLDLVQLHASPARDLLEQEDVVEVLQQLQREGKVRFIGCSSTLPNIFDHIDMDLFDVFQIPYSALDPSHGQAMAKAAGVGAGIVVRGGIAQGTPGEHRGREQTWRPYEQAKLSELAEGASQVEFLLRLTLSHPDLDTTIVGTINPSHLEENLNAARKGPLPVEIYEEATKRLALS